MTDEKPLTRSGQPQLRAGESDPRDDQRGRSIQVAIDRAYLIAAEATRVHPSKHAETYMRTFTKILTALAYFVSTEAAIQADEDRADAHHDAQSY